MKEAEIDEVIKKGLDLIEFGSGATDPVGYVLKPYYMKTCDGPLKKASTGMHVRHRKENFFELFYTNRISSDDLVGEKEYKCVRDFQYTNSRGEYEQIESGAILRLNQEEATIYIKRGFVLPAFKTAAWGEGVE